MTGLSMRLRGRPLAREIVLVLTLKAVAIAVIWAAFFNPGMRPVVDGAAIERHVTHVKAASPITPHAAPQVTYGGRAR
ncbi:MAG TPA: hypothetical protein VM325_17875 [Alphaproteobacteria bacterium]|nr:hypothetical protein [Alphaproteobacteria bacterium]